MSPVRERLQAPVGPGSFRGVEKRPFSFDVEFHDELTEVQRDAFRSAARRWLKVLVAGGPPVEAEGETIDGLLILAKSEALDRKGGLSANTDLDVAAFRGADAGTAAALPGKATITLDVTDMRELDDAEAAGAGPGRPEAEQAAARQRIRTFRVDLVAHEIGHALGLSRSVWERKGLLERNVETRSPVFTGARAAQAYGASLGGGSRPVPLEPFGDGEEFIAHWRQAIFRSELMTFLLEDRPNLIGPVTVAALQDLGYEVNPAGVETIEVDFSGRAIVGLVPEAPLGQPARQDQAPAGQAAAEGFVYPTHRVLRNHRWLNCRVRTR